MAWRIAYPTTALAFACLAAIPVQAEPERTVEALRVTPDGRTAIEFRVAEAPDLRRWLTIACVAGCARPIHVREEINDPPLGLLSLDGSELVYSLWATGCCYVVRVWRVTPTNVEMIFEKGSRGVPSVRTFPDVSIETYMRPTDERGRDVSTKLERIAWAYEAGKFVQIPRTSTARGQ